MSALLDAAGGPAAADLLVAAGTIGVAGVQGWRERVPRRTRVSAETLLPAQLQDSPRRATLT